MSCSHDAGRGRMAGGSIARTATGVLRARARAARDARGRRRSRPQGRRHCLAPAHPRRRLCVGPSCSPCQEAAGPRVAVWPAGSARAARRRLRIQSRSAGRKSVSAASEQRRRTGASPKVGRRVATGCLRAPQRRCDNDDSAAEPSPPTRLFVTRSPADSRKIHDREKKGYSTSSVVLAR